MSRKNPQAGFIEIVFILGIFAAGAIGLAVYDSIHPASPVVNPVGNLTPAPTKAVLEIESSNETVSLARAKVQSISSDFHVDAEFQGETKTILLAGVNVKPDDVICPEDERDYAQIAGAEVYVLEEEALPGYGYIFLEDSKLFNKEIIETGNAAFDSSIKKDYLYKEDLKNAEKLAQTEKIGIWKGTCPLPTPTITSVPLPTLKKVIVSPTKKLTPTPQKLLSVNSITGTPTVTPKPTKIPTPTISPINSPTPKPTLTLAPTVTPPPGSLSSDAIFILINVHRKNKGLSAFEKDDRLCSLVASRAPELYDEIFITKKLHQGLYDRELPYWITENMAHYNSEDVIVNFWLNSTIHRQAIEGNYKYSCGACNGNSCAQLFTNWTAK